jgi:hypothetical protein
LAKFLLKCQSNSNFRFKSKKNAKTEYTLGYTGFLREIANKVKALEDPAKSKLITESKYFGSMVSKVQGQAFVEFEQEYLT